MAKNQSASQRASATSTKTAKKNVSAGPPKAVKPATALKSVKSAAKPAPTLMKKKTASGTVSKSKSTYSTRELDHFKKIILDKRKEILEELQILKENMMDVTTGEYENENSAYSMHMEQGTDAMEREKTFMFASREGKFLNYLDDALVRIEKGTYGLCIECLDTPKMLCKTCPLIPKERLEAVPHAQLCVEIKNRKVRA
ncbi:MAG TPA: conjugal transfer protein TraR [Bacteroidota bacterium]|nr:conjugal transfer protein TraR [Bacteroidota bacterium]